MIPRGALCHADDALGYDHWYQRLTAFPGCGLISLDAVSLRFPSGPSLSQEQLASAAIRNARQREAGNTVSKGTLEAQADSWCLGGMAHKSSLCANAGKQAERQWAFAAGTCLERRLRGGCSLAGGGSSGHIAQGLHTASGCYDGNCKCMDSPIAVLQLLIPSVMEGPPRRTR